MARWLLTASSKKSRDHTTMSFTSDCPALRGPSSRWAGVLAAAVMFGAAPAQAEPPPEPAPDTSNVATPSGQPVTFNAAPGQGLTVKVGDAFSLELQSRIQLRYQLDVPYSPPGESNDPRQVVSIGTARLWFSGNVIVPELTYMIQLAVADRDFRDGAKSPIYDAYIDWALHRDIALRAGQFFVPFDRLRTVREWALQMADRPRPVAELTLDRDVGVVAYSDRFLADNSPVAWRLGVFGGGGTNLSLGKEPGALVMGRVEVRPLGPVDDDREGDLQRRKSPGLALGAAFAANINTNRARSTTGATFSGGTTDYLHAAGDVVFKWWGFALQGEYVWRQASDDVIRSIDAGGAEVLERTRSGHGWVAQASYVFDPPLEVVGRLSRLYAIGDTDPAFRREVRSRGFELGAGLNYYFNDHKLKLQADWIARMPPTPDFSRAEHVLHVQVDASF